MRMLTRGLLSGARVGGGIVAATGGGGTGGGGTGGGGGGTGGGTVVNLGTAIAPYLHQPGQVITVGAGRTYTAGIVDFSKLAHPVDSARDNRGWLVIVAEEPDVEIDLSGGYLNCAYDAVNNWIPAFGRFQRLPFRVLLVGFKIKWGRAVFSWLDNLRFWYCKFTSPIEKWNEDGPYSYREAYKTLHGSYPALMTVVDVNAFALMGNNITATPLGFDWIDNAEFWFCDFFDCGEDGWYGSSSNALFHGCRWWKFGTKGYDYLSPSFPGQTHMHSDGLQSAGGTNIVLRKFAMGAHLEMGTEAGSTSWDISDGWGFDSPAWSGSDDGGKRTNGTMRRVKWFGNGRAHPIGHPELPDSYDPDADALLYTFPGAYDGPPGMTFYLDSGATTTGYNFAQANHLSGLLLPTGMVLDTAGGRLLSDDMLDAALAHDLNPAIEARAESNCGIGDWQAYFDALEVAAAGSGWPA